MGPGDVCYTAGMTGDTCGEAIVLDPAALPLTFDVETPSATNQYQMSSGVCERSTGAFTAGSNAKDRVFSFTPSADATYQVSLVNPSFDAAFYVVTDCDNIDTTCLSHGDQPDSNTFDGVANTTYFIIVDGWSSGEGTLEFTIEEIP